MAEGDGSGELKQAALEYHRADPPGKLGIVATKPLGTQRDLSLAYSPGVAAACEEIAADPAMSAQYTARGNLVGVISNGTAVLGLGSIGALASKPVMEGKAVLFKKFAGIDVFDIEIDELDSDAFIDTVARLEPTFGGINLEDIKGPECFYIEEKLRERMKIPVFHDDQHGTAICVAAAVRGGLAVQGKSLCDVRLVCSGAGAAALACLNLLVGMGLPLEHIVVLDIEGVVYKGRPTLMDPWKDKFARETDLRTLDEAIDGADIFLGLSAPGVLKPQMVRKMADKPVILALANPTPEIMPDLAKQARPDAVIATGRSDFPNQVNNVLCFPFLFRGALDVGATQINEDMKIATVEAISNLARRESSDIVTKAYGDGALRFGPEYLIPKPFDPRLVVEIAPAVAEAAMRSGVASRPIADMAAYKERLARYVYRTAFMMKPIFEQAKHEPMRIVYCEGEEERVLRAVQVIVDERLARPILVGRRPVIAKRVEELALRLDLDRDLETIDPQSDERYNETWRAYHEIMQRKGVSPDDARTIVRTDTTVIGAMMMKLGHADSMIAGVVGRYRRHLDAVADIVGKAEGVRDLSAVNALILPNRGVVFVADTQITPEPTGEELAEMAILAAEEIRRFGVDPKIAFLSHSNFGSSPQPSAERVRQAVRLIGELAPELEVEGEMHGDAAVSEAIRNRIFPNSRLKGAANLLIMPNRDAANIAFNLLKGMGDGLSVGPILIGAAMPAHIITPSATVRGIVNMTALACVEAQAATKRDAGADATSAITVTEAG